MGSTYQNLPLETISDKGKLPESRIKDCSTARNIFNQLMSSYRDGRGMINTLVKRALDGNPPFDQQEMDRLGMSDCSNLNFRLLEADITDASIPLYNMFREVPYYIDCKIDYGTQQESREWSRKFSEEHKRLMDEWKGFDIALQQSIRSRVTFGSGPFYYPDDEDFRFRYAAEGTVIYPSLTSLETDKMDIIFITYQAPVSELYQVIQKKAAKLAGWRVEAVQELLSKPDDTGSSYAKNMWEEYQRKIRHNDLGISLQVPEKKLVQMFIKEFSGKITHAIFSQDSTSTDYLFYRKERFNNWRQIIHPMFAEIGDGYWAGVKGLGVKGYNFRDTQNRLKNRLVDAGMKSSTIMMQGATPEAEEDIQMTPMGPFSVVPPGVNFLNNPLGPTLEKPIAIDNMLERDLSRNIAGYRQNLVSGTTNQPISATEAGFNASRQDSLSLQQVVQALTQMDDLYEEQIKRLVKPIKVSGEWQDMVKRFQNNCIKRGIPKEAFQFVKEIRAFRPIGRGSKIERNQILSYLLSISSTLPSDVRQRITRDQIAAISDQEYLDSIWPIEELQVGPTEQESEAQLENGNLNQLLQALVTPKQDHIAHATVHLAFVMEAVNRIRSTLAQDEQAGQALLLQTGKHVLDLSQIASTHIQEHMKLMWSDGKRDKQSQGIFNAYEKTFAYVVQLAQQFDAIQKKMQDAQQKQAQDQGQAQGQQQGQQNAETVKQQIEWFKVQQDEARKDMVAKASIERNNALAQAKIQLDTQEFNQKKYINDAVGAEKIKATRAAKKINIDNNVPSAPQPVSTVDQMSQTPQDAFQTENSQPSSILNTAV